MVVSLNPLTGTLELQSSGPLYSNTIRLLLHWPLTGGLLHLVQQGGYWAVYLVQQGGNWAVCGPAQSPARCTKCNSPPINGQCTNLMLLDVSL